MWLLTPPIRGSYENISASTRHHLSIDLHLRDLPCGEPPPSLTQASDCSSHLSASSSPQHSLFLKGLKGISITVEWLSLSLNLIEVAKMPRLESGLLSIGFAVINMGTVSNPRRFISAQSSTLQVIILGSQGWKQQAEAMEGAAVWAAPHDWLGLLSYRTQDHQSRAGPTHVSCVLPHQSSAEKIPHTLIWWGIFFFCWGSLFQNDSNLCQVDIKVIGCPSVLPQSILDMSVAFVFWFISSTQTIPSLFHFRQWLCSFRLESIVLIFIQSSPSVQWSLLISFLLTIFFNNVNVGVLGESCWRVGVSVEYEGTRQVLARRAEGVRRGAWGGKTYIRSKPQLNTLLVLSAESGTCREVTALALGSTERRWNRPRSESLLKVECRNMLSFLPAT